MLSVKLIGTKALSVELNNTSRNIKNFRKPLKEATNYMQREIQVNFPAKGRKLKSPWKPRKRKYSHPILNKTGKMKGNFKENINRDSSIISNPTDYFKFHQLGTRQMARREMLRFSDTQSKKIKIIFNDWLGRLI